MAYPNSLDALTNPTPSDTLASVLHDQQHANANDAIEAIETKLGTGASTPATTGHFLKVTGPGATAYGAHGLTASDVGADPTGTAASEVATHSADTTSVHGIADTSALATSSDVSTAVSTHAGEADPHTGYQKESEKGAASGYASLDASSKVPVAQIRGVNSGTSFPASPTTNDQFFRTDRGLLYYYDGTQWLTVQLFDVTMATHTTVPLSADAPSFLRVPSVGGAAAMYLVDLIGAAYIVSNDGSNYWGLTLRSGDGGTNTTRATFNTSTASSASWYGHQIAIGTTIPAATDVFELDAAKTGAPGNMYYTARLRYRLIG